MATTYSSNLGLGESAVGDTGWGPVVLNNWNLLDSLAPIGSLAVTTTEYPSASLNVKVSAGSMVSSTGHLVTYAGTTSYAVPSSQTSYLYLSDAGALTRGTGWPASGTYFVPLAIVAAGATTISGVTDARVVCRSLSQ